MNSQEQLAECAKEVFVREWRLAFSFHHPLSDEAARAMIVTQAFLKGPDWQGPFDPYEVLPLTVQALAAMRKEDDIGEPR